MIRNPLNSLRIIFNLQSKLSIQNECQCRQNALYYHKARKSISQLESLLEWFKSGRLTAPIYIYIYIYIYKIYAVITRNSAIYGAIKQRAAYMFDWLCK